MDEPVDGSDSDGLVGKDLIPCAERLVGRNGEASILIAPGNEFEENRTFSALLLGVCDIVQDDEIKLIEFGESGFQREISTRRL